MTCVIFNFQRIVLALVVWLFFVTYLGAQEQSGCPCINFSMYDGKPSAKDFRVNFGIGEKIATTESIRSELTQRFPGAKILLATLTLDGEINQRMLAAVTVFAEINDTSGPLVFLNSDGGEVDVAIEIGRLLFSEGATIFGRGDCFSACIFVYAGAHERVFGGEIGIHRPFSREPLQETLTPEEYRVMMKPLFSRIEDYLEEMGVSQQVLDLMKSVPSSSIRVLTIAEREQWGLGDSNVISTEFERHKMRDMCGEDYTTRYYAAEDAKSLECQDTKNYQPCSTDVERNYGVNDGPFCRREQIERKCGKLVLRQYDDITIEAQKCKVAPMDEGCGKRIRQLWSKMKDGCEAISSIFP